MPVILTALIAFAALSVSGSDARPTGDTQEKSDTQLVAQYIALEEKQVRWLTMIGKSKLKSKHKPVTCKDAEKAIVHYRQKVWAYQDGLYERRSPTYYPERRKNACAYKRYVARNWQAIANEYRKQEIVFNTNRAEAICYVFGVYCNQAIKVAKCESGYSMSINATNGQYLGMFQMGNYARSKYGHSTTALGQARSAYAYFTDSGKDWSPWDCKPW